MIAVVVRHFSDEVVPVRANDSGGDSGARCQGRHQQLKAGQTKLTHIAKRWPIGEYSQEPFARMALLIADTKSTC